MLELKAEDRSIERAEKDAELAFELAQSSEETVNFFWSSDNYPLRMTLQVRPEEDWKQLKKVVSTLIELNKQGGASV